MNTPSKDVPCPTCRKKITWSLDNPFRPFCSARCKLIDLGAWADEKHRIPGDPLDIPPDETSEEGPQ